MRYNSVVHVCPSGAPHRRGTGPAKEGPCACALDHEPRRWRRRGRARVQARCVSSCASLARFASAASRVSLLAQARVLTHCARRRCPPSTRACDACAMGRDAGRRARSSPLGRPQICFFLVPRPFGGVLRDPFSSRQPLAGALAGERGQLAHRKVRAVRGRLHACAGSSHMPGRVPESCQAKLPEQRHADLRLARRGCRKLARMIGRR